MVMGLSVVVTQEGVSLKRLTRGVSVAPTGLSVLGAKGTGTVHFSALRTVYEILSYRPKSVLRCRISRRSKNASWFAASCTSVGAK